MWFLLVGIILSLCWGSFLNVVAFRLVHQLLLFEPFSLCPECNARIQWYDNIPVISYVLLRGKCRSCKKPISFLYPTIEILSAFLFPLLWYATTPFYFIAYFILFSALIVTIRTDLEFMLISRFVTIFLIPFGLFFAYTHLLPITPIESMLGTITGYFFLWSIAKLYRYITGKEGMGQGDFDLLAFIGSFTGPFGCWITLLVGSTVGSIIGLIGIIALHKDFSAKLPFGPFLAFGAIAFVLFQDQFTVLLQFYL